MNRWRIVERDGNPKKAGMYFVILIYDEWENGEKTGRSIAEKSTRYFVDIDKNPALRNWVMDDQPDHGFAWTEQTGSIAGERVYAWLDLDYTELPSVPEGVEFWNGDV